MKQLIFIMLMALPVTRTIAVMINGTAARVGSTPISLQDVYFYDSVMKLSKSEVSDEIPQGEPLKKLIQKVMLMEMVLLEMGNPEPSSKALFEIESRFKNLRKNKKLSSAWNTLKSHFGKSDKFIYAYYFRSEEVERFLEKKAEALTPLVTDADLEKYIRENMQKFKNQDVTVLKPNISWLIKREKMQKGLEDWVRFLTEKYKAVNLL